MEHDGNAFEIGGKALGAAVEVEKKRNKFLRRAIWIGGGVVVSVLVILAEVFVLLPSLSNDVDLTRYWDRVVASPTPYFYENEIFYVVDNLSGPFRSVGEYGSIARMGLDGKNREVLVESNGEYSYDRVRFVGVMEGELYYTVGRNLRAVALETDGHEVREIADDVATDEAITMLSIKDDKAYYLDNARLWKRGVAEPIWEPADLSNRHKLGGLVIRGGLAYFMVDENLVEVDVSSGELVREVKLGSGRTWADGSLHIADEEKLVYLFVTNAYGVNTTKIGSVVTVDFDSMEAELTASFTGRDFDGRELSLSGGRYLILRSYDGAYASGDPAGIVVDLENGNRREVHDVEVFAPSADGYVYLVERDRGEGGAYVYDVSKYAPADLIEDNL